MDSCIKKNEEGIRQESLSSRISRIRFSGKKDYTQSKEITVESGFQIMKGLT